MSNKYINSKAAQLLLVDDNEDDVELTRLTFTRLKLPCNLHHVEDGVDCMAFLRKESEYANVPTPDLVLLDLNMPRKNGHEILTEMMSDETLCYPPVVVLSTSSNDEEVLKAYKLG
jgi:two-component system, chemotaxis family, response regulator Rcp1